MKMKNNIKSVKSFQGLILALQNYWASQGCVILQPFDTEVGGGNIAPCNSFEIPR